MQCPVCKISMAILEHRDIELDYCLTCKGVWFDAGELELLFESAGVNDFHEALGSLLKQPDAATKEKKYRCPICRKKMKKVLTGESSSVVVDVCPQDDGIWLDHGEINHLAKAVVPKTASNDSAAQIVLDFLADVFRY